MATLNGTLGDWFDFLDFSAGDAFVPIDISSSFVVPDITAAWDFNLPVFDPIDYGTSFDLGQNMGDLFQLDSGLSVDFSTGDVFFADGSLAPMGSTLNLETGSVIDQYGNVLADSTTGGLPLYADGSYAMENMPDFSTLPDTGVSVTDAPVTVPENFQEVTNAYGQKTIVYDNGTTYYPESNTWQLNNGNWVYPNGEVYNPATGSVAMPNGTITDTAGNVVKSGAAAASDPWYMQALSAAAKVLMNTKAVSLPGGGKIYVPNSSVDPRTGRVINGGVYNGLPAGTSAPGASLLSGFNTSNMMLPLMLIGGAVLFMSLSSSRK
jgi:hypothetical protein